MQLVFATNNAHKLEEARAILGDSHEVLSLRDIGCSADIPETADTLEGNSRQKAWYIWERFALPCFADDTGLEVEALDGAPGVRTARYAGEEHNDADNRQKLLHELQDKDNRRARFRTIVTLIIDGKEQQFEGIVNGAIAESESGIGGFGYDPLFIPDEYGITFASLTPEEKNLISHRGRAIRKMCQTL